MATNSHAAFEQPNEHGHLCEQFVERDDLGPPLSTAEILEESFLAVESSCWVFRPQRDNEDQRAETSLGLSIEFRIAMQELVLYRPI